jgi:hypothetical protein
VLAVFMVYCGILQVCIVSGESGAGKTETTKHLIKHILSLSHGGQSQIENKIIQSSPVIEAFGNAQTVRNTDINTSNQTFARHIMAKTAPPQQNLKRKNERPPPSSIIINTSTRSTNTTPNTQH